MKKSLFVIIPILFLLCSIRLGYAVPIIFDNGPTAGLSGVGSDPKLPQFEADNFILTSDKSYLTDIHWWGFYQQPLGYPVQLDGFTTPDNFTIKIFEFTSGTPNIAPTYVISVGSSVDRELYIDRSTGSDIFSYNITTDPILLNQDTSYLISIVNNAGSDLYWIWSDSSTPELGVPNYYYRYSETSGWTLDPVNGRAFYLTGRHSVPEPSTILLLGSGQVGLYGYGRWRFKK